MERKFLPIPRDKKVLFQQLVSFLLEMCEFRFAQQKQEIFFSHPLLFPPPLYLRRILLPIYTRQGDKKNPED